KPTPREGHGLREDLTEDLPDAETDRAQPKARRIRVHSAERQLSAARTASEGEAPPGRREDERAAGPNRRRRPAFRANLAPPAGKPTVNGKTARQRASHADGSS